MSCERCGCPTPRRVCKQCDLEERYTGTGSSLSDAQKARVERSTVLHLQPATQEEAFAFVDEHHSTHDPPEDWKFSVGVNDAQNVVGVAVVGHPVSRHQDDGVTLEVTRYATDGTKNAASKLYVAVWRATMNMGYRRLITYTLADSEEGIPLRAVNGPRSCTSETLASTGVVRAGRG